MLIETSLPTPPMIALKANRKISVECFRIVKATQIAIGPMEK